MGGGEREGQILGKRGKQAKEKISHLSKRAEESYYLLKVAEEEVLIGQWDPQKKKKEKRIE